MMTTVADVIVEKLVEAGVQAVYGLPGGENVPLLAALQRADVAFVLVHNESSAVYMAAVDARMNGTIGVALTTLGPGALNAAAGLGHAFLDRCPVLLLTACMDESLRDIHTHQTVRQNDILAPMSKASVTLSAETVVTQMADAIALLSHGRPGPVHVQLSKQEAQKEASSEGERSLPEYPFCIDWDRAEGRAQAAERPVLVVGLGVHFQRHFDLIQEVAENLVAPVIVTPKGKGAFPADHPLYAGVLGVTRTDPVYEILGEADLIITVGFDVVELVKPWDETADVLWIAPWNNEDVRIDCVAEYAGDMQRPLESLLGVACESAADWGTVRVAAFRDKQAAVSLPEPKDGRLRPQTVLEAVWSTVPAETTVTTDVGAHKILTGLIWPASDTYRAYFLSNGLSCMGYGLPAAIAASRLQEGAPVVSITGDGGMAMVIGELGLLAQTELPVIIVVMNDSALDLIRSAQHRAGEATFGTEFVNPNWVQIAQAYGIAGVQVSTAAEVASAVARGLASKRPILIDALIDPISYPTTP